MQEKELGANRRNGEGTHRRRGENCERAAVGCREPEGEPDFAWPSRLLEATSGRPLWILPKRTRDICLGACLTANFVKQAAPGLVSTRGRFMARCADERPPNPTMDKTARAVVFGSRPFNTMFGLLRNGENIERSLGTF